MSAAVEAWSWRHGHQVPPAVLEVVHELDELAAAVGVRPRTFPVVLPSDSGHGLMIKGSEVRAREAAEELSVSVRTVTRFT